MPTIQETIYPRLKSNLSFEEIITLFTPTEEELELMRHKTKSAAHLSQLGFMILLKAYQCLGYACKVREIPSEIQEYTHST